MTEKKRMLCAKMQKVKKKRYSKLRDLQVLLYSFHISRELRCTFIQLTHFFIFIICNSFLFSSGLRLGIFEEFYLSAMV